MLQETYHAKMKKKLQLQRKKGKSRLTKRKIFEQKSKTERKYKIITTQI